MTRSRFNASGQLKLSRFSPHAFHLDKKVEVFAAEGSPDHQQIHLSPLSLSLSRLQALSYQFTLANQPQPQGGRRGVGTFGQLSPHHNHRERGERDHSGGSLHHTGGREEERPSMQNHCFWSSLSLPSPSSALLPPPSCLLPPAPCFLAETL